MATQVIDSGAANTAHPPLSSDATLRDRLLWGVWGVSLVAGLIGLAIFASRGHLGAGYGSYAPWGLWIALYFHGVGIAAGAYLVSALGFLTDRPGFTTRASLRTSIVLSVAAIAPALFAVFLDLGRMDRAYRILTSPNFTSMMAFNSWMYMVMLGVLAGVWWLSFRPGSEWLRPLMVLGVVLVLMIPSQSGAFFGVVGANAFWHSALLPILFLTSSIVAGAATLLLVRGVMAIGSPEQRSEEHLAALRLLRRVTLAGLIAYFVLEFAEFSIALWSPSGHAEALELVLFGPYWWVFWGVHLLLGGVVPLALLARRSAIGSWMAASLLIAISFVSTRLNLLVPGQAMHELNRLEEAFVHPRLTHFYHATPMEYLIGFLLVAMGMTVLFVGHKLGAWLSVRIEANR